VPGKIRVLRQNGKITGIIRMLAMPTMMFIGTPIFRKSLNL